MDTELSLIHQNVFQWNLNPFDNLIDSEYDKCKVISIFHISDTRETFYNSNSKQTCADFV